MSKKKTELPTFENVFLGEYVEVVTNQSYHKTTQSEEGITEQTVNISYDGFLLETDDLYYYLGGTPREATAAIKIDSVVSILIKNEQASELDDMLDRMPTPDDSELQ